MFLKKYKIKTSTTLKGSERKKLRSLVESQYPSLSSEDLNSIVSSKNELSQTKVLVHSGAVVLIYCCGSNPMFFVIENRLFPTLYTLWRFPDLLPIVPTVPAVLEKICNGADLMAPGIIVNESTVSEFQNLKANDICAVRLEGNRSPIAVGTAVLSDTELLTDGRKGKAVLIVHCYKDNLWASGDQTALPIVAEIVPDSLNVNSCDQDVVDHQEVPGSETVTVSNIENKILELGLDTVENSEEGSEPEICEDLVNEYSMDDILNQCFMLTLKANGKRIPLPILTSTFYRTYVLNCCPPNLTLDIKKTTHKKLSVFLKLMSSGGLIDVKELTKGVESIVAINFEHDKVKTFIPDLAFKEHLKRQKEEKSVVDEPQVQDKYKFPEIIEMYVVSAQVKMLFESMKIRKGEALTASKVRDLLREYVKANSLQLDDNPRMITLDPVLTSCLLKSSDVRTSMTWEELFEITMSRMSPAYTIAFEGEDPKLKKGHIDLIDISVATRSGNKKVTLISNLENFGIKPEKLANYVQVAVAASTSVSAAPNGKGTQVLIQGNQLRYLQTLFFDVYKVPKKYVRGLEGVSAKKKKK